MRAIGTVMSKRMQPIRVLAEYCGDGNPVIVEEFVPGWGWRRCAYRKRASVSWLRTLQDRYGVTSVSVNTSRGTAADFPIHELLPKVGLRG